MNIEPLRNRVLVKRETPENMSAGGIYLPDQHQVPQIKGKVLAVGPGRVLDNGSIAQVPLKKGDRVLFLRGKGLTECKVDDDLFLLSEEQIIGRYTD